MPARSHVLATKIKPLPPLDELQRYTIGEAILYLRSSRRSVYAAINEGKLNTIKERKRRYVPGSEIARLCRAPTSTTVEEAERQAAAAVAGLAAMRSALAQLELRRRR